MAINTVGASVRGRRPMRRWLSNEGTFLFGKHEGGLVDDVAVDDEKYVRWCVEVVEDMVDEDRTTMEAALQFANHHRRGRRGGNQPWG
jgi:hypothetical protein